MIDHLNRGRKKICFYKLISIHGKASQQIRNIREMYKKNPQIVSQLMLEDWKLNPKTGNNVSIGTSKHI